MIVSSDSEPMQKDMYVANRQKFTNNIDKGSSKNHFIVHNFVSTVTKFRVMWEDKPSNITQNFLTVGRKLWTAEPFLFDGSS